MRPTLRALGPALLLAAAVVSPARAATASTAATPAPLTIQHAVSPVVASYGHTAVAVVQRTVKGKPGPIVAYTGGSRGWSKAVPLTPTTAPYGGVSEPSPGQDIEVALAPSGCGAAAWLRELGGKPAMVVRLRSAGGAWSAPRVLAGAWTIQGLAVDAACDVSAAGWADDGLELLAHVHGAWHTAAVQPDFDDAQLGIDATGRVHVVNLQADRGGTGAIQLAQWTAGGGWTRIQTVPAPGRTLADVAFAVQPNGTEYVAAGGVSSHWRSTSDGEFYWATKYTVLARKPGAAWRTLWSRDGAEALDMVADAANVRLYWRQLSDADAHRRPQRLALYTKLLGPRDGTHGGTVQRLGGSTVRGTGPQLEQTSTAVAPAPSAGAHPAVVWQMEGPTSGGDLGVWSYHGTEHVTTTYPDARPYWMDASVTSAPGWLAYASRVVYRDGEAFESDGTVEVVPVA